MMWHRKHLLDIESLSVEEINIVLDTARSFKAVGERAIKKVPALRGKTVVNLFIEPSTRTRISFELAELRLSADIINFTAEASSLKKGETLKDTARNLEALNTDFIVIRHSAAGAAQFLARVLDAHVINAGLAQTNLDALIMHPGPINRGVEIDSDIADSVRSLILEQVTNGLAVRMAALFLVNGGKGPQEIAST